MCTRWTNDSHGSSGIAAPELSLASFVGKTMGSSMLQTTEEALLKTSARDRKKLKQQSVTRKGGPASEEGGRVHVTGAVAAIR